MCYNTGKFSPKFYFHKNQILYCTVFQCIAVNMCITWFNPYSSSYLSRAPEIEESGKIFQLDESHPFLQRPNVKSKEAFSWPFEAVANSVFIPWTAKFYRMYLIKKKFAQCQYHWHGPPEVMNQTTSGFFFSIQTLACPWTNMLASDLHVGGMG